MKPFTTLTILILGLMALGHLYRLVKPFEVVVGGVAVPQWVSVIAVIVTGVWR